MISWDHVVCFRGEVQGSRSRGNLSATDAATARDQHEPAGVFSPSAFKFDLPLCVSLAGLAFEAYLRVRQHRCSLLLGHSTRKSHVLHRNPSTPQPSGGFEEHDAATGVSITYLDKCVPAT